jgi:hypothetical protein
MSSRPSTPGINAGAIRSSSALPPFNFLIAMISLLCY